MNDRLHEDRFPDSWLDSIREDERRLEEFTRKEAEKKKLSYKIRKFFRRLFRVKHWYLNQ